MKDVDLTEILKDCPKGTKLYSSIFGDVEFVRLSSDNKFPIIVKYINCNHTVVTEAFTRGGYFCYSAVNAECTLFPSRECRDWSQFQSPQQKFQKGDHVIWKNNGYNILGTFVKYNDDEKVCISVSRDESTTYWNVDVKDLTKIEKFDPKLLKTGDEVLVRNFSDDEWYYGTFSHIMVNEKTCEREYIVACCSWKNCIPYNNETQDLVGTKDNAPEFYNI